MKTILITGVTSYIGNAVARYLQEYNQKSSELYHVDKISLRGDEWEKMDFTPYDTILHVAGIAHADIGHVSEETQALYYNINCYLTEKVAKKAKAAGIRQFIYMSSVIVYGDSAPVGQKKMITENTPPQPSNFYGDSKWQAEQRLRALESEDFAVAVLRPPMIYGKGSKGNFPTLVKLAGSFPVFPATANERSILYVENLAEFIRLLIERGIGGTFFPQDTVYASTPELVRQIGSALGRKIRLWKLLNPLVRAAAGMPGKIGGMAGKAFGSLTIAQELSNREITDYQLYSLEESIQRSVAGTKSLMRKEQRGNGD